MDPASPLRAWRALQVQPGPGELAAIIVIGAVLREAQLVQDAEGRRIPRAGGRPQALDASVTRLEQQGGQLFSNAQLRLDLKGGDLDNRESLINTPGRLLLENLGNGEMALYRIVGPDETDAQRGWISIDAPLARAMLKKRVDDEFDAVLPGGIVHYAIIEIRYPGG